MPLIATWIFSLELDVDFAVDVYFKKLNWGHDRGG